MQHSVRVLRPERLNTQPEMASAYTVRFFKDYSIGVENYLDK